MSHWTFTNWLYVALLVAGIVIFLLALFGPGDNWPDE